MGIFFGLSAAFFWGLGDYLISHLTRHSGTARALVYVQVLSLLAWIVFLFVQTSTTGNAGPDSSVVPSVWAIAVLAGIFHVVGLALTYRAFEIGTLSLVSPIASGFAVVTAVLSIATGEHPPALAVLGALCLIAGVVVATRTPSDPTPSNEDSQTGSPPKKVNLAGVPEALGSALAFGTMFWMFYFFVQPKLGYVYPLIILKTMSSGGAIIGLLAARSKTSAPDLATSPIQSATSGKSLSTIGLLALGVALTDTLAWISYIWGTSTQYATVVTALASLFSVITILLAWVLLRERLSKHQWVGVAVILLGVLLVSI